MKNQKQNTQPCTPEGKRPPQGPPNQKKIFEEAHRKRVEEGKKEENPEIEDPVESYEDMLNACHVGVDLLKALRKQKRAMEERPQRSNFVSKHCTEEDEQLFERESVKNITVAMEIANEFNVKLSEGLSLVFMKGVRLGFARGLEIGRKLSKK